MPSCSQWTSSQHEGTRDRIVRWCVFSACRNHSVPPKWRNLGGGPEHWGRELGAQRLARSARPSRAACGTSAPQAKKILHTYTSPHAVPPSRSAPSRRPLRGSAARVRCAIALRARPAAREASPPTASPSDATHSPPQQQHALPPSSSSCRARDASSAATRGTRSRSRTSRSGSPPLRKLVCPRQRPDGRRSPRTCISTPSPRSCVGNSVRGAVSHRDEVRPDLRDGRHRRRVDGLAVLHGHGSRRVRRHEAIYFALMARADGTGIIRDVFR